MRSPEQEPLREVAAELGEDAVLLVGLDAFGDDVQVDAVRERDDAADDRLVARLAVDALRRRCGRSSRR